MDLSIFLIPATWISLITLIFLECVLGIDNLVFITITTDRLPKEKQHLGRALGLVGALVVRIILLSIAASLILLTDPLFTIDLGFYSHGFSIRDVILLAGGAYLIYKGIAELRGVLSLREVKAKRESGESKKEHQLGLGRAIATIMVMDAVFSIDSVITAVGLSGQILVMVIAVMIAVGIMIVFIDPIANFINNHPEMKILALTFIALIGILLVLDALGIHSSIMVFDMYVEKLMVYFSMLISLVLTLIQMRFNKNLATYEKGQEEQKKDK